MSIHWSLIKDPIERAKAIYQIKDPWERACAYDDECDEAEIEYALKDSPEEVRTAIKDIIDSVESASIKTPSDALKTVNEKMNEVYSVLSGLDENLKSKKSPSALPTTEAHESKNQGKRDSDPD